MPLEYLAGLLRIANLFIAIFILLYAYLFLNKTSRRSERKPWDYLFISSFIFLLYQIFALTTFFGSSDWISQGSASMVAEFMFSGLVLLAFVSQHDLIVRTPLLLISRKTDEEK